MLYRGLQWLTGTGPVAALAFIPGRSELRLGEGPGAGLLARPQDPRAGAVAGVRAISMAGFAINVGSCYVLTRYVPFFDAHEITTLLAAAIDVAAPADARDRQWELRAADVAQHNHLPVKTKRAGLWMAGCKARGTARTS